MGAPDDIYPYTQAWKATVDKSGEDWRRYCEVNAMLRRYYRTRMTKDRAVAHRELAQYLASVPDPARAQQLKRDFIDIGLREGAVIEKAILEEQQHAETS